MPDNTRNPVIEAMLSELYGDYEDSNTMFDIINFIAAALKNTNEIASRLVRDAPLIQLALGWNLKSSDYYEIKYCREIARYLSTNKHIIARALSCNKLSDFNDCNSDYNKKVLIKTSELLGELSMKFRELLNSLSYISLERRDVESQIRDLTSRLRIVQASYIELYQILGLYCIDL